MITINGETREGAEGKTLGALLRSEGYSEDRVAAGLNGKLVRRADYGAALLKEGDEVQVFHFMGGG